MTDVPLLWIVGKFIGGAPDSKEWEFVGVFSDSDKALAACSGPLFFIGPAVLNEAQPDEITEWIGAYYPAQEKLNAGGG